MRFCTKLQKYQTLVPAKISHLGVYNYSYIASAVRALMVKINNTSARRWRALEEGVDIAMGLSTG